MAIVGEKKEEYDEIQLDKLSSSSSSSSSSSCLLYVRILAS